jgi:tetraacyldisaccharide 4'-kinase
MWILRVVLLPLSLVYGGIMSIRNLLFDQGILKARRFDLPVISVGNLSTGGTGKSPTIEYLVRLLGSNSGIGILSRGYGRKTGGYLLVSPENDFTEYGDEPHQFKKKFLDVNVAVCEDRVEGVQCLLNDFPDTKVILLDDAFQHRWIKPGLSILLIPYTEVFTRKFLLPAGNQREWRSGLKRADIIVVSKSPDSLKNEEMERIRRKLGKRSGQEIYFSGFKYAKPLALFSEAKTLDLDSFGGSILLLTGIANPGPLNEYLRLHCQKVFQASFPDHHEFFERDLDEIQKIFNNIADSKKIIITTEKDSIRLRKFTGKNLNTLSALKAIYFIPIEVYFFPEIQEDFNKKILNYVGQN